jgi:hypothetical protein
MRYTATGIMPAAGLINTGIFNEENIVVDHQSVDDMQCVAVRKTIETDSGFKGILARGDRNTRHTNKSLKNMG